MCSYLANFAVTRQWLQFLVYWQITRHC